jgi:hypothetical protein
MVREKGRAFVTCSLYHPINPLLEPHCGHCGQPYETHPRVYIITGSRRDDVPKERVWEALDAIQPRPRLIVQGGAAGVDWAARYWARRYNVPCATHEAYWKEFGDRAGPIRNKEMLEGHPDAVVYAFPGPQSRGTRNCIAQAKKLGMPVKVFEP